MAKKRETLVILEVAKIGKQQEFEFSHAERLLNMGVVMSGGWALPEDSKYTYTKENGLRVKTDRGSANKAS